MTKRREWIDWRDSPWRFAPWGIAFVLLLVPAIAMRLGDAVAWDAHDFLVMAALLALACGAFDLAARASPRRAWRAATGIVIVAALFLSWLHLAVGLFPP